MGIFFPLRKKHRQQSTVGILSDDLLRVEGFFSRDPWELVCLPIDLPLKLNHSCILLRGSG